MTRKLIALYDLKEVGSYGVFDCDQLWDNSMENMPPLNFLRSFEASARTLSFTDAASELNLTQAAVSGHIRALEQFIGGPLFHRHPRSISLTSLGKAYLPDIQQALGKVSRATAAIVKRGQQIRVVISCPVSMTSGWLADALAHFNASRPDVLVTVHGRVWSDEPPEIADIILTDVHEENLRRETIQLWRDHLVIVCTPDFQVEGMSLETPAQLVHAPLIYNLGRPGFWQLVGERLGIDVNAPTNSFQTNNFASAMALASRGLGVAVLPYLCVRERLGSGCLAAPFGDIGPGTWVLTISDDSLLKSLAARELHHFLVEQAEQTRETISKTPGKLANPRR